MVVVAVAMVAPMVEGVVMAGVVVVQIVPVVEVVVVVTAIVVLLVLMVVMVIAKIERVIVANAVRVAVLRCRSHTPESDEYGVGVVKDRLSQICNALAHRRCVVTTAPRH